MDRECLAYQNQAIACIRERMARMDEATTESTIGSILLLAGVEVRNLIIFAEKTLQQTNKSNLKRHDSA